MSKFVWLLKQLLPFQYKTQYRTYDGQLYFAVWRMWFGQVFAHHVVPVDEQRLS